MCVSRLVADCLRLMVVAFLMFAKQLDPWLNHGFAAYGLIVAITLAAINYLHLLTSSIGPWACCISALMPRSPSFTCFTC